MKNIVLTNKILHLLILLVLSSEVLGQQDKTPFFGGQKSKATKSAVKNLFLSSFVAIGDSYDWITSDTWDDYVDEAESEKENKESLIVSCIPRSNEKVDDLDDSIIKIADRLCKCVAWSNCPKSKACNCDMLCPDGLEIFNHPDNSSMNKSLNKNSFSFRNSSSAFVFSEEGMSAGYCWGHASATSKFNRLAKFRVNEKVPCIKNNSCKVGDEDYLEYMEDLIDDIMNNKPRTIPGFKNLSDFSSENMQSDSVLLYLGDSISNEWSDKAMSFQGLGAISSQNIVTGLGRRSMDLEDSLEFADDVAEKLKYGL